MPLIGNTFYQASSADPGAGYPMYYWHQTDTGDVYIRDSYDHDWVLIGNANSAAFGLLPLGGGNMNGAITGAHGLSSADSNDFSSLRVGGDNVATKLYVDNQDSAITASIATEIASAISTIPTLSLSSKVAWAKGTWEFVGSATGKIIDCPYYSDGIQAAESECLWFTYFEEISHGFFSGGNFDAKILETSNRLYDMHCWKDDGAIGYTARVGWVIVAFRKTS